MGKKNVEVADFLKDYVSKIEAADNDEELRAFLFKTIDYLMRPLHDLSNSLVVASDERGKRKTFSAFGAITKRACDFYQASKNYLDPEALNGAMGQELESTTKKIADVNAALASIEKTEAPLLSKQKELGKINEKYKELTAKVSELKEIKRTVSDEVLKALESERKDLDETINRNKKIKKDLDSQIGELDKAHQALATSIAKVNAEKKIIEETVTQTIDAKVEEIKGLYTEGAVDVDRLKAGIERYKEQYRRLGDELAANREEHHFYEHHLGADSEIVEKMKGYGIPSIEDFFTKSTELKNSIKALLDEFDNIIKKVIDAQEDIQKDIEKRNGTST
jgi:chromosome segregation ATPase